MAGGPVVRTLFLLLSQGLRHGSLATSPPYFTPIKKSSFKNSKSSLSLYHSYFTRVNLLLLLLFLVAIY